MPFSLLHFRQKRAPGDAENDDVNELVTALLWKDDDFGPRSTDSLTVGGYYVYR